MRPFLIVGAALTVAMLVAPSPSHAQRAMARPILRPAADTTQAEASQTSPAPDTTRNASAAPSGSETRR